MDLRLRTWKYSYNVLKPYSKIVLNFYLKYKKIFRNYVGRIKDLRVRTGSYNVLNCVV